MGSGQLGPPFCVAAFAMEQLSTANTHFAVDLFRALNESDPTGNIFISPLSISSALAMIFLGTRGNTAAQVSKVSRNSLLSLLSPTVVKSALKSGAFELLRWCF